MRYRQTWLLLYATGIGIALCSPMAGASEGGGGTGPEVITKTFTLTGQQPGGFNIRAVVQGQATTVPMSSGSPQQQPQALFNKQDTAPAQADKEQAPAKTSALFSKLFGMDESHHNPSEMPHHGQVPTAAQKLPPGLVPGHSFPGTDNPYVCHNYVAEALTGAATVNEANPNDVTEICSNLGMKPHTIPPDKKNLLPNQFPPGTVIQYQNHVGIIGQDGKTLFNYTQAANSYGQDAGVNQDNPLDLWKRSYQKPPEPQSVVDKYVFGTKPTQPGRVSPYSGSPVTIWTPPGH